MFKLDLHTHSVASPDGGITKQQYKRAFQEGILDCIAITDHNTIDFAQALNEELGERVIVGEEITTTQGEIVGLFLKEAVQPGQSARDTVKAIKDQGGIVYVPHPFETVRSGISAANLDKIAKQVDIIEVHNGRAFVQNKGPLAATWAAINKKTKAVASDAHGFKGLGHAYCKLDEMPTVNNLRELLDNRSRFVTKRPPLHTLLYPKLNRLKKIIRK